MYPQGHYGPGIRGLGDALTDISNSFANDVIPLDAGYTSFAGYTNWISPGVASGALSPSSTTNATGSNPTARPTINQAVSQNSGLVILLALGMLGLVLLKR